MSAPIQEPPPGCLEIPGFILTHPQGWLTQDGEVTSDWNRRGVWATAEEAREARERFTTE